MDLYVYLSACAWREGVYCQYENRRLEYSLKNQSSISHQNVFVHKILTHIQILEIHFPFVMNNLK